MNDRQLKYILTVAETGNITTAAKKLYISQPSLSSMLGAVEKELGTTLFERTSVGLVPTYAGECYIKTAKKILNNIRELELQVSDAQKNEAGELAIGCCRTLSSKLFPMILPHFHKLHPGYQLKLYEDSLTALHNILISGILDILITYSYIDSKDIAHVPLYRQELLLLAPKSLELPHTPDNNGKLPVVNLSMPEIASFPFAILKQGNHLRTVIDRIFQDYRVSPDIILETNNWQTCAEMVKQNEALSILPYSELGYFNNDRFYEDLVEFYRFNRPYYRVISIYYKKSDRIPTVINHFINFTQKSLRSNPFNTQTQL